jgi:endonuclease/exonuclease/phosphatase family metal-dependent hydrolase
MDDLTVVTLNLHGGQRNRGISTPRLRQHGPPPEKAATNGAFDVAGALRSFDADVLVLQESWWPDEGPAAVDLVAAASGATMHWASFGRGIVEPWPHIISARPHRACGRIGLAVVSRVPARLVEMIPVGDVPGDPALRRCALHLSLDVGGRNLDLIAVHLSSRLPYAPPMQIRNLRRRLPPPELRTVIVGDFNLWGPAVTALLPGWRRAVRGRTWPAHRPHSQIDHVLVRNGVGVVDAAVLDEVGSDHRPVRVTLRPV